MFQYVILGILQGIFEWLPVSSEGAVALASNIFKIQTNAVDFSLFLHMGTLAAVIIYFWKDFINLLLVRDKKFFKFFILATAVSLLIGFPVYKFAREFNIGNGLLILMGAALIGTAFFQKQGKKLNLSLVQSALAVGFLQGLAAIPGLSRSGSTIFGLSLSESDSEKVLRTSFMLSAPAVFSSSAYLFFFGDKVLFSSGGLVALVFSFLAGLASLNILLIWAKKINFFRLVFIFGILCLIGGWLQIFIF
ncbi:MAG: undecaprenyl-diphosphate phosphatase [Candidatus Pacebacteria bacterium]|nr:undecaprenyl-diphosphate phosphatase [Candidatus Paceibacterota bacterium]MDD4875139.1 undecaprenyl-diphosphate phosphatase [Candidatus Paceibacterota bacterium]